MSALRVVRHTEPLVVGSGVAGLSVALGLGSAVVVGDLPLGEGGSSRWAQGGIAAAVGHGDSPAAHAADTLAVSGGLGVAEVVELVCAGGPAAIERLVGLGARFDRGADGRLTLGREAGHGARRIVHADGDATGAEVMRALADAATRSPAIRSVTGRVVDLLRTPGPSGRVVGVVALGPDGPVAHLAPAVVLATGGYGHAFARTTNPPQVVGTGAAMVARAGGAVADMEMVQFHPTALAIEGVEQLPLLTEALRGEGAVLVDETGHRFVLDDDPAGELAPRDVVARAIYRRLQAGHRPVLDARAAVGDAFPERFPTVFALATAAGFDPRVEPLPVTPAAHYSMGGVATDARGRTSLDGLWAVGEVASSGVHGANRLASNSLLEGLVVGEAVAGELRDRGARVWPVAGPVELAVGADVVAPTDPGRLAGLRSLLWRRAGVVRDGDGLAAGRAELAELAPDASGCDDRDVAVVAGLVLDAASARTESRGAHFRSDHPDAEPADARRRSIAGPAWPVGRWDIVGDRLRPLGAPVGAVA
ncbi:MAG: L-aspartate oxidase [Actinomycetota bacterium]|nr:L-aspartate oxidase [Actinomycetota bacterium]